jgi:predicted metal-dependent hydrolase
MKADGTIAKIRYGSRLISYKLQYVRRKRLKIVVTPELQVLVFAPETANAATVQAIVTQRARWIARTIEKLASYHPLPAPKQFVSGETFVYLGRQYRLKVEQGHRQPAKLLGKYLYVWTENKQAPEDIRSAIHAWYQNRAQEIFGRYLSRCYQVASRHGVPEPVVVLRRMRRRWGSCSPAGRITLNLNLIQAPVHCIEYVIMHELCHLKCHNHAKTFYALLSRCQPDWRRRKIALDKIKLS